MKNVETCETSSMTNVKNKIIRVFDFPKSSMETVTENYQLKWHSFSSHLYGCVANYFNNESFSDVVLVTMDGHQIFTHRFVLSTCSQYFHQVLKNHKKLPTTLPLVIVLPPEINYNTMKILTQYMYTGETTVSKDILESVLRGGDLLKIQGLWRPREEGYYDKNLVKVHQKNDATRSLLKQTQKQSQVVQQSSQVQVQQENTRKEKADTNNKPESKEKEADREKQSSQNSAESNDESSSIRKDVSETSSVCEERADDDKLQFLVIKEEPIEWNEVDECEMELIEDGEVFHSEMTIKPEIVLDDRCDDEKSNSEIYSPLTCELCSETFSLPADWVKHIQSHTDMMPAKRQRRGRPSDDDPGSFPPLHCDMCEKYFPTPAEWVHHIQNTHTEFELRLSNKTNPARPIRMNRHVGSSHKVCTLCDKRFPSHASMLIHKRTHTGEKPYKCEYCYKGFNVKSNLLRHLRTLHDKIINSTEIESKELPSTSEKSDD